ncbi:THAP domain-containing protein 3 [Frankliniella fusca]|uniref:THAP domain-containing protein 3 n=1 Tax=Frankliniella fusca TaxID=407009 RepID=A0AAE1HA14_9NEOP|nr:THAP domain-containing protein 3 [Frankliniella fusca]
MSDRVADSRAFPKLKDARSNPMWLFGVKPLFKSKQVQGHVDGTVTKPVDATKIKEIEGWIEKDAEAQLCIMETLEPNAQKFVLTCGSSQEMFLKIKGFYEKDNEQHKCLLYEQFHTYRYDRSKSILDNISILEDIQYKLKNLGQTIDDIQLITKIIKSLPEENRYFAPAWDSVDSSGRTLKNLRSRLQVEELRIKERVEDNSSAVFHTESLKQRYDKSRNESNDNRSDQNRRHEDSHHEKNKKLKQEENPEKVCFLTGKIIQNANVLFVMKRCSVPFCTNASNDGFIMSRFPTDSKMKRKWTLAIGSAFGTPFQATARSLVCSEHFEPEQWVPGKWWLKPYSVPTVFKICLQNYPKVLKRSHHEHPGAASYYQSALHKKKLIPVKSVPPCCLCCDYESKKEVTEIQCSQGGSACLLQMYCNEQSEGKKRNIMESARDMNIQLRKQISALEAKLAAVESVAFQLKVSM